MRILALLFSPLAVGLSAPGFSAPKETAACPISETVLGPVPKKLNAVLSPDQRHIVYPITVLQSGKKQVLYDGRPIGAEFAETFVASSVAFDPKGRRIAFARVRETGDCTSCGPVGKWRVAIDGREDPEYDVVNNLTFGHDGSCFAYGAMRKIDDTNLWFMVVNGVETFIPYEAISAKSPAFTPVSSRLVYIAKKGDKATVVVDGREGPLHDKIVHPIPCFSDDGQHIAYVARDFDAEGGTDTVMLDGKSGPRFDFIPAQSLIFSPDSRRHAYGGQRGGVVPQDPSTWVVVVDGKAGPEYDQVDHISFSPDSRHVAYKARKDGKWTLIVDGAPTPACDELADGFPVFSPDSSRIAYGLKTDNTWKVCVQALPSPTKTAGPTGVIGDAYEGGVGLITFSPDGKHLAFGAARNKRRIVVVDGAVPLAWSERSWDMMRSLVYSPDGTRIACEVGTKNPTNDDKWELVVDGRTLDFQTLVGETLVFSADSRHFAFKIMKGENQQMIVDGRLSPEYKSISHIFATADNGFESIVIGEQLSRIKWRP